MTLLTSLIPSLNHGSVADICSPVSVETPSVKPAYEIREAADSWGLVAQLPGVQKDDLEITVDQQNVRILGRSSWKAPEGWTSLYRETTDAPFELILEHDNAVDADRIHAELKDGILVVNLPKAAAIKPRKISVG